MCFLFTVWLPCGKKAISSSSILFWSAINSSFSSFFWDNSFFIFSSVWLADSFSCKRDKLLLFFFILLSINISYSKTPEKKDFSLSYLLNVTDEHGKYTVHVYEYKSKDTYYRRDDWESENKGNVSYIIIKENNVSSYLIIHDMKKIYSLSRGTGVNTILEESWIGDLHLKLIEKEKLPPEKYEGYMCKKTRYINKETGKYISQLVGICNRAIKCGYHFTPK